MGLNHGFHAVEHPSFDLMISRRPVRVTVGSHSICRHPAPVRKMPLIAAPYRAHTGPVATRMIKTLNQLMPTLRYEPTGKWIRASHGGRPVLDTRSAVVVWEPMRATPIYAVPESDVLARLEVSALPARQPAESRPLFPDDPFIIHTAEGTVLDVEAGGELLPGAAFRFRDPDLTGYIEFDFLALDWLEEDEPLAAHARDPFHRVDIRSSSRHVRVEANGVLLAESTRPLVLFETMLPARFYLPVQDVHWEHLEATDSSSDCPYKGTANYWKLHGAGANIAWSYARPVSGAEALGGLVCFYNEHVDLIVDGRQQTRPQTPFN